MDVLLCRDQAKSMGLEIPNKQVGFLKERLLRRGYDRRLPILFTELPLRVGRFRKLT